MLKVKEVLRLRFELGLGQRAIAGSCRMGLRTVHDYLEPASRAGIGWPLAEGLGEVELEAKLFGNQLPVARTLGGRPEPEWKAMHEQLQQHRQSDVAVVVARISARASGRDIATVGSASAISSRGGTWIWCCDRNTKPGRKCSWTGRERRFPSMTPPQEDLCRLRCLWLCSVPALTPMRKQHAISANTPLSRLLPVGKNWQLTHEN